MRARLDEENIGFWFARELMQIVKLMSPGTEVKAI